MSLDPDDSSLSSDVFSEDSNCGNSSSIKSTLISEETETAPSMGFSGLHDVRMRWSPSSWRDGTRRSAFQPYRPTTVLTNLQRGNMPTETPVPEQEDVTFHHRAGQGEITEQDIQQETVDAVDNNGLTPLMWASSYGQVPTVNLLLRYGAEIDKEGPEGETPLLLAAAGGHHDVVRTLLSGGADVNHMDEMGNTALMYAAYGNHPHCTNELLIRGADITMMNINGDTAFAIAVAQKSQTGRTKKVIHNNFI